MPKIKSKTYFLFLIAILATIGLFSDVASAQEQRWIIIGETQCFFMDYGAEDEPNVEGEQDYLTWPTQYGDDQYTCRMNGLWLGARNFHDPVENKEKTVKVIGSGPRLPANHYTMIFPQSIKLIGRDYHPQIEVDKQTGTTNTLYDLVDEYDSNLPCDRMVIAEFNTSLGISVTRKVYGFAQQNHDNYFIQEYVFKNTGIYNENKDIYPQDLEDFWVYFNWRPAFAGVTSKGWTDKPAWGAFASEWGTSTLIHTFNLNSPEAMRGFYAYYGPTNDSDHPLTPAEDWGCPDHLETGVLGSAKYMGGVVLFASKPDDHASDDPSQPATDAYLGGDGTPTEINVSQYDVSFMQLRYNIMTEGHLPASQDEDVFATIGNDGYVEEWTSDNTYRSTNTKGSSCQGWGFGPYDLADGDSIRIVFALGITGLSWEKCREVGANWYAYYKSLTVKPDLYLPGGSPASGSNPWGYDAHNAYKRAWCETGRDSILQVLQNAISNYNAGFAIPQPPPPPASFTVSSGGDRIRLTWGDNAYNAPNFNGYVIYRSEGNVKHYKTVYTKIFECDKANCVHEFDDVTAARGNNYYYYIQSKSDGLENNNQPLYSSIFWTLTSVAAYLRRPSGNFLEHVRVVPNPYDIRARMWQFGDDFQYDRIAFYELPPICIVKVFTERGDLIWEKYHDNGSGDELWDSMTSSRQIVVSGVYILYVEVPQDIYAEQDIIATRDYYNPKTGDLEIAKGDQ